MEAVNVSGGISIPEIYAMKQATKVQERAISKILEGLQAPLETSSSSRSNLTSEGIGQSLDLLAWCLAHKVDTIHR